MKNGKQKGHAENKKLLFVLAACLIVGFIAGVIIVIFFSSLYNGSEALVNDLKSFFINFSVTTKRMEIFKDSIIKYGKYVVFIWFLAFLSIGVIFNFLFFFFKGLSLGFTTALLLKGMGAAGALYGFFLYFLQNLIFIPVLLFVGLSSFKIGMMETDKNTAMPFMEYFFVLLIGIAAVLVIALFEAFIAPAFLDFILGSK